MLSLIEGLRNSPDVIIHQFDFPSDRALIVRLPAEMRRTASFLDDRILGRGVEARWALWSELESIISDFPAASPGFIFHIGHCGSTLISRLLGETTGCNILREPVGLRTFANAFVDERDGTSIWPQSRIEKRLQAFLNLISKPGRTVIKATSFCTALIDAAEPVRSARSVFCYVEPRRHLAAMLGGQNNHIDLKNHGAVRLRRLRQLCGAPIAALYDLSPGELAAMSWAADTACMAQPFSNDQTGRILPVEFDRFLAAPETGMTEIAAHFSLATDLQRIRAALNGPIMQRYSKDANFEYSPELRNELLLEYAQVHQREIENGLNWLLRNAKLYQPIARALDRFGGGL